MGFKINNDRGLRGFQIQIDNLTVSVQFSRYNYCDGDGENAEIAVIRMNGGNGDFLRIGRHDDVVGYVNPRNVIKVLSLVAEVDQDSEDSVRKMTDDIYRVLHGEDRPVGDEED